MNIQAGVFAGQASGFLAGKIALCNGRSKPTIKDRCHAAMIVLFGLFIPIVLLMSAHVFTFMDKLISKIIDWDKYSAILPFVIFLAAAGCFVVFFSCLDEIIIKAEFLLHLGYFHHHFKCAGVGISLCYDSCNITSKPLHQKMTLCTAPRISDQKFINGNY